MRGLRELIELGVSYEWYTKFLEDEVAKYIVKRVRLRISSSSESSQNPVKFLDKDTGAFKTYDLQKTPLMSPYNPELCS